MKRSSGAAPRWREAVLQIVLVIIGIAGAAARAFPAQREKDAAFPVIDGITLAWLGLLVVAYLLPRIEEVSFGETSLKLRQQAEAATSEFEQSVIGLASLLQNWTSAALIYRELLESSDDVEKSVAYLLNYLRDRMAEAKKWLSDDPEANVRIAFWVYEPESDDLEFLFSNEIDDERTMAARFKPGEGLLGQAFLERRMWNEPDARQIPGFKRIRTDLSIEPYDAVMCIPAFARPSDAPLGAMTFDKAGAAFTGVGENIGSALAATCAYAYQLFLDTPV